MGGDGLRYIDVDIHLIPEPITDGTEDDAKAMRKRKKDNTIQLTMVPNGEKGAMESYFAEMGIDCKVEGQATPQRKLKKGMKKKQNGNEQKEAEEEEDGEDESSSDEEYNIEEDEANFANDDDDSSSGDDDDDDDEEDDIDMADIRDVLEAGKENAAECENQK